MIDSSAPAPDAPIEAEPVEQPVLPVAEHAKRFSPQGRQEAAEADAEEAKPRDGETDDQAADRVHHSAQQKREKETGQFRDGKKRASTAVARIGELTGRAKTAEERLTATEARAVAAEAELERYRTAPPATPARQESAPAPERQATQDLEPTEDDPKFAGDYGKYLRAVSAWEGRQAYRQERQQERSRDFQEQHTKGFQSRIEATTAKYPDLLPALDRIVTRLPETDPRGQAIIEWIFEERTGPEIGYYLDQHPQDLDALLRVPSRRQQTAALALLAQRFTASPSRGSGGATGAPTAPTSTLSPHKPPTPVRTEAQRTSGAPATDGTLTVMQHAKSFKRA